MAMRFSLLIASVLCVAGVGAKVFGNSHQTQPVASHVYIVKQGDTLYSIALKNSGQSNLSQYLFTLEQENHGSSHIVVGQRLILPQP
jgi:LysM repeat protein